MRVSGWWAMGAALILACGGSGGGGGTAGTATQAPDGGVQPPTAQPPTTTQPPETHPIAVPTATPSQPPQDAAACAEIALTSLPPAREQEVSEPGARLTCGPGTADANGTMVLAWTVNGSSARTNATVLPASGAARSAALPAAYPGVVRQPAGALWVSGDPQADIAPLTWFDAAGAPVNDATLRVRSSRYDFAAVGDPSGGVLVAGTLATIAGQAYQHAAVVYSGPGAIRWGPRPLASAGSVAGAGVDLLGRALVITAKNAGPGTFTLSGEWFDRDGTPLTGEFTLPQKALSIMPGLAISFETSRIIGGGLAIHQLLVYPGGTYRTSYTVAVVPSGSATVQLPPAWMTSRQGTRLELARGGKAYAVLPLGTPHDTCSQAVEVLGPDGIACGTLALPMNGARCNTLDLELGADGTLVQRIPPALDAQLEEPPADRCAWRWWPGALR